MREAQEVHRDRASKYVYGERVLLVMERTAKGDSFCAVMYWVSDLRCVLWVLGKRAEYTLLLTVMKMKMKMN